MFLWAEEYPLRYLVFGKQASLDPICLGLCFLSLRITKFIKIPLPPGLLNHDNRHRPPSLLLSTSTEAISSVPPKERITFTRQSVVIPSIFLRELRPLTSISSEGHRRTYSRRTHVPRMPVAQTAFVYGSVWECLPIRVRCVCARFRSPYSPL